MKLLTLIDANHLINHLSY